MTPLFAALQGGGVALLAIALVWTWCSRRERRIWRRTGRTASTVAMVLELEEQVRELERRAGPSVRP